MAAKGQMNNRRKLVIALGACALGTPLPSFAQQPQNVARIGYLSASSAENDKDRFAAFQQGLRELGYVEGKNIVIEQRYAAAKFERLPELAEELARLKLDVFVVYGPPAAVNAIKKATSRVPIVMTLAPDPVGDGLVASLAHPGGQVTGLSDLHSVLAPKRLEILKELVPSASRVAVLTNPDNPSLLRQVKDIEAAAPAFGVKIQPVPVRGPEDIDRAFAAMKKQRPDGILVLGDALIGTHRRQIVDLSAKNRLPLIATAKETTNIGGLLSYGANFSDLWRRAATYVDKILKGAKPGDLPIEQPTRFELVINIKTAKALGIQIPNSILVRADKVIE